MPLLAGPTTVTTATLPLIDLRKSMPFLSTETDAPYPFSRTSTIGPEHRFLLHDAGVACARLPAPSRFAPVASAHAPSAAQTIAATIANNSTRV